MMFYLILHILLLTIIEDFVLTEVKLNNNSYKNYVLCGNYYYYFVVLDTSRVLKDPEDIRAVHWPIQGKGKLQIILSKSPSFFLIFQSSPAHWGQ